jgi:hypothetical protein
MAPGGAPTATQQLPRSPHEHARRARARAAMRRDARAAVPGVRPCVRRRPAAVRIGMHPSVRAARALAYMYTMQYCN